MTKSDYDSLAPDQRIMEILAELKKLSADITDDLLAMKRP